MRFLVPLLLATSPTWSQPVLQHPVDCTLGQDCYVQYLPDRDPGPGTRDSFCGELTYDGHKGTDYGLLSLNHMRQGVTVRAAADGVVQRVRDGMEDKYYTDADAEKIRNRECGNAVLLNHGEGWTTLYCHLRNGSITVKESAHVDAGTALGLVGLSGKTQFPHLHITVRDGKIVVDPNNVTESCDANDGLWDHPPAYLPGGLIDIGFSDHIPEYAAIKTGSAKLAEFSATSPALVVWGYVFGAQSGDQLKLSITGPAGTVVEKSIALTKSQPQLFRAIGRKTPDTGWPSGAYRARVVMQRGDKTLDDRVNVVTIP